MQDSGPTSNERLLKQHSYQRRRASRAGCYRVRLAPDSKQTWPSAEPVGALGSDEGRITRPAEALGFGRTDEARAARGMSRTKGELEKHVVREGKKKEGIRRLMP